MERFLIGALLRHKLVSLRRKVEEEGVIHAILTFMLNVLFFFTAVFMFFIKTSGGFLSSQGTWLYSYRN